MDWLGILGRLLQSGLGNLAAYLAAHVLLCLVPAFYIAGALSALVPKEAVTRFLGRDAPKVVSYPAAAAAGSLLAVCSCTIVPLFAGIYKKGAGLGPAITFLFFAPAANILALAYTGVTIGPDLALARLFLSLAFGIGIGLIMALLFSRGDALRARQADASFARQGRVKPAAGLFVLGLVALLLAGTLKLDALTRSYGEMLLPLKGTLEAQAALNRLVPFDAGRGEEGVTVQGVALIGLLGLVALVSWRGLDRVLEGFNRWTGFALALTAGTLLVAAAGVQPRPGGLAVLVTGKLLAVSVALPLLALLAWRGLSAAEVRDWLWESWRFIRQIFPLLVAGVFAVGIMRQLIRPEWIEALAGRNTLLGNAAAVLFGVFMYFPTLVEVPVANMFLRLGMHRGPLLAYLMADPELSLQSILVVTTIIGRRKAWVYVGWVALFSTLAGLLYGAWVDGASMWLIAGYVALLVAALAAGLAAMERLVLKAAGRRPRPAG